ncbi:response regulator transcription factor [Bradyrhizobium ganzhouense]|uniref:response regulator transcription factor n=1 Tax=Bradyrhizobium ganzhouense TaxID=1179767 RepID=UPI003CF40EC7
MSGDGERGGPSDGLPSKAIVLIVDDDAMVRRSLDSLLRSVDLETMLIGSADQLLNATIPNKPGCIVLDVRLPGTSGLDLQDELVKRGIELPIIFMTGFGDIPMTVKAMKAGAVDFLSKPFREQDMLDAVATALRQDARRLSLATANEQLRKRYETLTPREREIMSNVVAGLMNKQIAGKMGLSEITVKIHRGHVMRKMEVKSLADLVRVGELLGVSRGSQQP